MLARCLRLISNALIIGRHPPTDQKMTSPELKIIIKMSLSFQRSAVESFSFRGKNVRSVHVPDLGECLVGIDVSRAIGYADDNNDRRAIKRHVRQKYMMQFEEVKDILERLVHLDLPQDNAIVLKEPGLYCFLRGVKCLGPNPLWNGPWKQFCHGRFEN